MPVDGLPKTKEEGKEVRVGRVKFADARKVGVSASAGAPRMNQRQGTSCEEPRPTTEETEVRTVCCLRAGARLWPDRRPPLWQRG